MPSATGRLLRQAGRYRNYLAGIFTRIETLLWFAWRWRSQPLPPNLHGDVGLDPPVIRERVDAFWDGARRSPLRDLWR